MCSVLILLVPLAAAGLALMNAGLGSSRSSAHALVSSICAVAVATVVYIAFGFSWQGYPGRPAHEITLASARWNWLGGGPFFLRGLPLDATRVSLAAWLEVFSVAIAAVIPLGAGNGRWRLGAICASTALLAGWTYPLFAHWVWGGGWLAQLAANFGLGHGFLDGGGSAVIQMEGGLTALSIASILGPRRGKYAGGAPMALPGHSVVLVLFACFLAWLGWIGLNGSGSMLFLGAAPSALPQVAVNTTVSAGMSALAAAGVTRLRYGRPDASLCANGWTGGLAASSAACAFASPAAAALTGAIAGALVTLSVELLDVRLGIDDPAGSVSVHAVGGLVGVLSPGLLARLPGGSSGQWLAQWIGAATLLIVVLPLTYSLNRALNRFYPQRISAEDELHGLDLLELGAEAYPEFVTRDDFRLR